MSLTVSDLAFEAGDWEAAREPSRPAARLQLVGRQLIFRQLREAELALGVGDEETAAECLEELEPLVARSSEPQWIGAYGALLAELRRRQRDLAGARAAVTYALDRIELCTDDVMRIARVTAAGMRVEADIAERARDLREKADERDAVARARIHMQRLRAAASEGGPVERAWQAVGAAELARARGRSDPKLWITAAREWEAIGRPYVRVYCAVAGDRGVRRGRRPCRGVLGAETALEEARKLGARWLEDELVALAQRARLELGDDAGSGTGSGAGAGRRVERRRRRGSVRADRARAPGAGAGRRGRDQPADRRGAVHGREDRQRARVADPRQARRAEPYPGCGGRAPAAPGLTGCRGPLGRDNLEQAPTISGSSWVPATESSSAARHFVGERLAVGTVGAHRVPGVAAGDDPGLERDLFAGEAVRVAAAVPALVVGADDDADLAHEAADALEHLLALDGVGLDDRPLVGVELAGLVDDLLGDRDLADVVEERGELEVAPALGARGRGARRARARAATTLLQCSPV